MASWVLSAFVVRVILLTEFLVASFCTTRWRLVDSVCKVAQQSEPRAPSLPIACRSPTQDGTGSAVSSSPACSHPEACKVARSADGVLLGVVFQSSVLCAWRSQCGSHDTLPPKHWRFARPRDDGGSAVGSNGQHFSLTGHPTGLHRPELPATSSGTWDALPRGGRRWSKRQRSGGVAHAGNLGVCGQFRVLAPTAGPVECPLRARASELHGGESVSGVRLSDRCRALDNRSQAQPHWLWEAGCVLHSLPGVPGQHARDWVLQKSKCGSVEEIRW